MELIRILTEHGMYRKAFALVCRYGYEGCDAVTLLKLCSRMILEQDFAEQEELLALADHVYREGKYNDVVLVYLRDNYLGAVEDMATLCGRSLCGFGIDTYTLDEEILMLSMFTRVYLKESGEILESYRRDGGKEKVILAYMTFLCFGWFMEGRPLEPEVSSWISRRLEEKGEMDRICRLAYLKWLSGLESLGVEQERQARHLLQECQQEGLRFAFCQKLPEKLTKAFSWMINYLWKSALIPGIKWCFIIVSTAAGSRRNVLPASP